MNKTLTTAIIICTMISLTSCSTNSSVNSSDLQTSVLNSQETIKSISTSISRDMVKENKKLIILDVRTPEEYFEGHIENAINLDVNSTTFATEITKLNKESEYLVYCRSGNRSLVASELMKKSGFKNIFNMEGGFTAWRNTSDNN
jgi:rhodanese-related sulfurtransferase